MKKGREGKKRERKGRGGGREQHIALSVYMERIFPLSFPLL
jgi:hypothetical protein